LSKKIEEVRDKIADLLLSLDTSDEREEVLSFFAFQLKCECCWIYVTGKNALDMVKQGKTWEEIEKSLLFEGL
jgi:hypothetical protein